MILPIIQRGISYLGSVQQDNGGFLSFSTSSRRNFNQAIARHSTFSSAFILSALCRLPRVSGVDNMKRRTAHFLITQKSQHWSFNYWQRNSSESREMPYPDDLDDTFAALAALQRYDSKLLDGTALAKIVSLLASVEQAEGGPYRTWLVVDESADVWKDVDIAVNSNVATFLSLIGVELPKVTKFIEGAVCTKDAAGLASVYYPSMYPIVYFITRFYRGNHRNRLQQALLSRRDKSGGWGNSLHTALAISSLLAIGTPRQELKSGIAKLIKEQQRDGSWKPTAFCIDPSIGGDVHYAGSSALSTAFCLEAITAYFQKTKSEIGISMRIQGEPNVIATEIAEYMSARLSALPACLKEQALRVLERTLEKDSEGKIRLLPYFFKTAIGKVGEDVPRRMLVQLGAASMYGWIAYTIYDDILDGEANRQSLPIANTTLRELTVIFTHLLSQKDGFTSYFQHTLDIMEEANIWELAQSRFVPPLIHAVRHGVTIPDYGDLLQLAHKSAGHMLGAMGVLFWLGYGRNSREVKQLESFFVNYLIARQLNDDAHDWEADLKQGHINAVGAMVLKLGRRRLKEMFWNRVFPEVCGDILKHVAAAKVALRNCQVLADPSGLEDLLLLPLQRAAQHGLDEHQRVVDFLKGAGRRVT